MKISGFISCTLAVLLAVSCVPKSKYNDLLYELENKQVQIETLEHQNSALIDDNAELQERVSELEDAIDEARNHMQSAKNWLIFEDYFLAGLELDNTMNILRNSSF